MPTTLKTLIDSKYAESAETTQIPAVSVKTVIDKFTAINRTASNANLAVRIIVPGGANPTIFTASIVIFPGKSYHFPEIAGHVLEVGAYVSTLASAANAIAIRASGREIT